MANQQLITYIKTQVANGASMDAIRTALLGAGWADADVNEAMTSVGPAAPVQSAAVQPAMTKPAAAQPISMSTESKPIATQQPAMTGSASPISAVARPQASAQPATVNLSGSGAMGSSPSFKVDEVVFRPEFAGGSGGITPTTMAQMAPVVAGDKKSGGSRIWFFVGVVFILLTLVSGAAAGYFYNANSDLQGRITSLSAQNARLSDQSGVTVKDRKTADEKIAALTDANADLATQLSIFVLPTGTSTVAADRPITIRGTLGSVPIGYTLTTSKGIVLGVKNSKDPKIDALLKPFVGTAAEIDGVIVPGVREITFIGFSGKENNTAKPVATSTMATTTTSVAPNTVKATTTATTTVPVPVPVPSAPAKSATVPASGATSTPK